MSLADKIARLRKKNGWSQEELAERMNVSRQAVSKWESAQAVPDIEKLLQLSALFGVTTDQLLKDGDELDGAGSTQVVTRREVRRIRADEAYTYIEQRKRTSRQIALATLLCILSPITLILLAGASEVPEYGISESLAAGVGLIVLFTFVLIAVPIFIYCAYKNEPYAFLDSNEPFELEGAALELVSERKRQFRDTYIKCNMIATCICIFSPLPLLTVAIFVEHDLLIIAMVALMMLVAGIGVFIFITVGVQNASLQKLLGEGDYTEKEKARSGARKVFAPSYWGVVTAIDLAWSFLANSWEISWIVFAVGGVLFPIAMRICDRISDKNDKNKKD